jgi:tetratricopeptide (TPR) repeat protein
MAVISLDRGLYETAIGLFTQLLETSPTDFDSFYRRGVARYKSSFYSQALADVNQAISLDRLVAEYFYFRSLVHTELGNTELSKADFDTT